MYEEQIKRANELYRDKQFAEASILLHEILLQQPNHISALLGLAACSEDPKLKEYFLRKVLVIDPGHPQAKRVLITLTQQVDRKSSPRVRELGAIGDASQPHSRAEVKAERVSPLTELIKKTQDWLNATINRMIPSDYAKSNSRFLIILGSLALVAVICLIIGVVTLGGGTKTSDAFNISAVDLLREGDALIQMTSLGVTAIDYRHQLAVVKANYSFSQVEWPESLLEEQQLMEQAVTGWDLAAYFINNETDLGIQYYYNADPMILAAANYLGKRVDELNIADPTTAPAELYSSQMILSMLYTKANAAFSQASDQLHQKVR